MPGLTELGEIEAVTSQIALPLNVLWRPGLDQRRLAAAGVARISTGSGPYRRAPWPPALATAVAARDGTRAARRRRFNFYAYLIWTC